MSWEGELFGVGLFAALAESYPEDVAQLEELGGTPETHEVAPLTAEPT
jgi:hypothetical protein